MKRNSSSVVWKSGQVTFHSVSSAADVHQLYPCVDNDEDEKKDEPTATSSPQRVAYLWDADDTLVCTKAPHGPRGAFLESLQVLSKVFVNETSDSSAADVAPVNEHFVLTLGTVDDLFEEPKGLLAPFAAIFDWVPNWSACRERHRLVPLPAEADDAGLKYIFLPAAQSIRGISLSPAVFNLRKPSTCSVIGSGSKLGIAAAFACSGHWDRVVLIDNSLEQLGCLSPSRTIKHADEFVNATKQWAVDTGRSSQEGNPDPTADHPIDHSMWFHGELSHVAAVLASSTTGNPIASLDVCHLWIDETPHKVLPGEQTGHRATHAEPLMTGLANRLSHEADRVMSELRSNPEGQSFRHLQRADQQEVQRILAEYVKEVDEVAFPVLRSIQQKLSEQADETPEGRTAIKALCKQIKTILNEHCRLRWTRCGFVLLPVEAMLVSLGGQPFPCEAKDAFSRELQAFENAVGELRA